ncbi:hypothetical protein AVEN_218947-1, partial [Araneus ventricosus]
MRSGRIRLRRAGEAGSLPAEEERHRVQ